MSFSGSSSKLLSASSALKAAFTNELIISSFRAHHKAKTNEEKHASHDLSSATMFDGLLTHDFLLLQ
eukprot:113196-Amphidinium_carterae.2